MQNARIQAIALLTLLAPFFACAAGSESTAAIWARSRRNPNPRAATTQGD